MRGVTSEVLEAIIDFLYSGEATVYQDDIEAFLALAEELNPQSILSGNTNDEQAEETSTATMFDWEEQVEPKTEQPTPEKVHSSTSERNSQVKFKQIFIESQNTTDIQKLDETVKSLMTKSQNNVLNRKKKAVICTVCGKEGEMNHIKDHIENNHLEGVSIPCNYCKKTFRSRESLRRHTQSHK